MQSETSTVQALTVRPDNTLYIQTIPADWPGSVWVDLDAKCREVRCHIFSRHATYQEAVEAKKTAELARAESD